MNEILKECGRPAPDIPNYSLTVPDTASTTAVGNELPILHDGWQESIKAFIEQGVLDEQKRLETENTKLREELSTTQSNYEKLKNIYVDNSIQLEDCKKQLAKAQELIRLYETREQMFATEDKMTFQFDEKNFHESATQDDIKSFFTKLYMLANTTLDDGSYLFDCQSTIVPLYFVLTNTSHFRDTRWQFCGDFRTFCDYWNENTVKYIHDETRASKLRCKYESMKSEKAQKTWTNSSPGHWAQDANAGGKKSKTYLRASLIKQHAEAIFK